MIRFREKTENLFLWGHQLEELKGVPGVSAKPKEFKGNKANLSFKSWGRVARNTSLQAAVQYGPSLSNRGGLGFLQKVEGSLYTVTPRGEALAKALDQRLRKRESYNSLIDLDLMFASEKEAKDLFVAWRLNSPGAEERATFYETFFDDLSAGQADALGSRSLVICLVREILKQSRGTMELDEIRKSMTYGRLPSGKRIALTGKLQNASKKWILLQVRQMQRLAIESLMSWVEYRLLKHGERSAQDLAAAAVSNLRKEKTSVFHKEKPVDILADWLGRFKSFDEYIDAVFKDADQFCMFTLGRDLEQRVRDEPDEICEPAFRLLLICRRFHDWFATDKEMRKEMPRGGSGRVSLEFWAKTWDKNCNYPLIDLVSLVLSNMVLSQHFAVATNRFDGGTQRLRITIEEEGLEILVSKPWQPYIAADRLGTLVSLMADCGLISENAEQEEYSFEPGN